MNIWDAAILCAVAAILLPAVRRVYRNRKTPCCGCCAQCPAACARRQEKVQHERRPDPSAPAAGRAAAKARRALRGRV